LQLDRASFADNNNSLSTGCHLQQQPTRPSYFAILEGSAVMKPARLVCLLLSIAVTVSGQSNPVAQASQAAPTLSPPTSPNRQGDARLHQRVPINLPSALQGRNPASTRLKLTAPPSGSSELNFAAVVNYNSGGLSNVGGSLPTTSVVLADVNGDGKLDMVIPNYQSSTLAVLLGNGDGTFQPPVTYTSGAREVISLAVGDVNGDGKPDIVVANGSASNVGVLLGNGDGTFQAAVTYPSGGYTAQSVAIADLNGDGKADLVVANCSAGIGCGSGLGGIVSVLLGSGDGTFQAPISYSSGGFDASSVVIGDANGDGKPDILVANGADSGDGGNSTVGVLVGNGDGTFQPAVSYGSGGFEAYSVALADLNGDGKPDLVIANLCLNNSSNCPNGGVGVLLGNGDGTFQTAVTYASAGSYALSVAVADVNGDSKPDIVVANFCDNTNCINSNGTVDVLIGNGDGTFQPAVTYTGGGAYAIAVAVADLNRDSKPDIVLANGQNGGTNGTVGVLINIGVASTSTSLVSSPNPSNVGQSVIFTATVTPQQSFYKLTPTGTASFFDGTNNLGSSTLNGSATATLKTSKLALGTHAITATYNGDANFTTSTSPVLSQVVQGAVVQLSPTSINFGNQTVGMGSNQGVLVNLTNAGNIALTISAIGITGADTADFSQNNLCPSSLAAGLSCTITVTFVPTTTGTRTASLSVTDNAPGSPQKVSLTGVGVRPSVSLSPTSLTFPDQVVFTTSAAQTVTLTNTGLGILSISKVSTTGSFTQTNTCGTKVAAGASCTFSVKFKPVKIGTLTGTISIADNASNSPQKIVLTGVGTYIQLTPISLNFGNQPVGTKSLPKTITLSNKGSVAVSITSIAFTGSDPGDFSQTNTCGKSVAAGASCSISVTFTPSTKGKRTANLSIKDTGGGSPQTASLTGTGT
jgi:hypothetical protein